MDMQTNTIDILDMAMEHIKNLQAKAPSENRTNCTCGSVQLSTSRNVRRQDVYLCESAYIP